MLPEETAIPMHDSSAPSRFLIEQAQHLPSTGRALDIACGAGRNALFLAERGLEVTGLDRDEEALALARQRAEEKGLSIEWRSQELEEGWQPERESQDVIVVARYLHRPMLPSLARGLRPGGLLVYTTFTLEQRELGRPKCVRFLLQPNELLREFSGLHVRAYFEGIRDGKAVAELLAEKPRP
ncbi:MAG: class I SAM-dependent methyltransferase [Planctomycetota bacterium]